MMSARRYPLNRKRVRHASTFAGLIVAVLMGPVCVANDVVLQIRSDGAASPARVLVQDGPKDVLGPTRIIRSTTAMQPYVYVDGQLRMARPKTSAQLRITRGIEFAPRVVEIGPDSPATIDVELKRWINMPERGWYSGDSHVHLHTGGPIYATRHDALLAAQAEDLHYANLCVSNNVGDDIRDADLITGRPDGHSTKRHLLVFGEEMRSSIYGHMQFFGIKKLVEPQYTGFDDTPNSDDYPPNYDMAAEAVRQGGLVTYGHPMFTGQPDPYSGNPLQGNAAARELPIDLILGKAHAIDLMSYNSDEELSTELWYRLLNCGLRLSACVGTDALLDQSTNPMGGDRMYVHVGENFTMQSWLAGLKNGRTIVTNGPILDLIIDGKRRGDTIEIPSGRRVTVKVELASHVPVDTLELVVNGTTQQVWEKKVPADTPRAVQLTVDAEVEIERSSWIALRARGPESPFVFDGRAWAHTSPIFVTVGDEPIQSVRDAQYFVEWIEKLIAVVKERNRYPSAAARDRVVKRFREAQQRFQRLASQ